MRTDETVKDAVRALQRAEKAVGEAWKLCELGNGGERVEELLGDLQHALVLELDVDDAAADAVDWASVSSEDRDATERLLDELRREAGL